MIKTSATKAIRGLETLADRMDRHIPAGVDRFVETEMKESQRIVPVDTGELKGSDYQDACTKRRDTWVASFGYTAEHAAIVHEDMEVYHPNGQAKYLEQPFNESAPYMPDRVFNYAAGKVGIK